MLLCFFVSPKWNPTSTPQSFPISLTDTSHLLLSVWAASLFVLWHWSRWSTGLYISAQSSGYSLLLLLDIPSPTFKSSPSPTFKPFIPHHPPSNHWFFHLIYFWAPPLSCEIWYYASQLQNAIGLFKRFVSLSHYKYLALAMSDAFLFFNEEIE